MSKFTVTITNGNTKPFRISVIELGDTVGGYSLEFYNFSSALDAAKDLSKKYNTTLKIKDCELSEEDINS